MKTGATAIEPEPNDTPLEGDDYIRMNIDKANQQQDGSDAIVIGNVGNGTACEAAWRMKRLVSTKDFEVTSDISGAVWILIGTESGFEGLSELVYTRVLVSFWELSPSM